MSYVVFRHALCTTPMEGLKGVLQLTRTTTEGRMLFYLCFTTAGAAQQVLLESYGAPSFEACQRSKAFTMVSSC
jgi:hypothetical protein